MKKMLLIETAGIILNNGQLMPGVIRQLIRASELGYELFLVSEQDIPLPVKTLLNGENLLSGVNPSKGIIDEADMVSSRYLSVNNEANPYGLQTILFKDWESVYAALKPKREAVVHRKTNETDIAIKLNLDGEGRSEVHTGVGFFDHMLDQLAKHSISDLIVTVNGDLHIDEHHTVEDTALALGEAFLKALGDKRGIERYGFCLPMDDALAQVAIDFGGRPWLVWNAEFKREKIGEMPTELFYHFFKSFSDSAKCNINIQCEGDNEHHKIEAIFKAFAKCIKMAKKVDATNNQLPSTKGVL